MSLPDSAEYWWDVKGGGPYLGPEFYCIENVKCGYRHHSFSKYLRQINCKGCLKLLKENGNIYNLDEGLTKEEQKAEARINALRKRGLLCECGCKMVERENKKVKRKFLGCSNYPKCKKTKSII